MRDFTFSNDEKKIVSSLPITKKLLKAPQAHKEVTGFLITHNNGRKQLGREAIHPLHSAERETSPDGTKKPLMSAGA